MVTPSRAAAARATASMSGLRSTPVTVPVGPSREATMRATIPVPHPTSRTLSPGLGSAISTRLEAHGANSVGTV